MSAQLTALIVDDEAPARENLRMLLEEFCPEIRVLDTASGVRDASEKIENLNPQVVFLDIRMPSGAEGFELLDSIEDKKFQVVFVTAFKDYAIRALNANAIHYLLKPIDIEDLQNAVCKLVEYHESIVGDEANEHAYAESLSTLTDEMLHDRPITKLTLYHSKGFKIVECDEVVRLEADGNCTAFYFKSGGKYLDTKTLKIYEELLSQSGFIRIHKSHVINLNYLESYLSQDGHTAIMKDGSEVPVARARLSEFLTAVKNLG